MPTNSQKAGEASRTVPSRPFDLNIQRVLEHWTPAHAVREVIANALDEQALTETGDVEITKEARIGWHIRDFGRGIRYEHFTQNEDAEKLAHPSLVVGKFGVGLKDALAAFDRHGIRIHVQSKHVDITIGRVPKHGFEDVQTLHAVISPASDQNLVGTDFVISGVTDGDVEAAKSFFLRYSSETELERNEYGAVLGKRGAVARILRQWSSGGGGREISLFL